MEPATEDVLALAEAILAHPLSQWRPRPELQFNSRNGNYYLELPNPFPGGSTYSMIEIYQYDDFEWFWRDDVNHYLGPWPTRAMAEKDARETYEKGWIK